MRLGHRIDGGADVRREGRGFSQTHVNMHGHVFRGSRQPAFIGVTQLLEGMQALFIGGEQGDGNLQRLAEMNLDRKSTRLNSSHRR